MGMKDALNKLVSGNKKTLTEAARADSEVISAEEKRSVKQLKTDAPKKPSKKAASKKRPSTGRKLAEKKAANKPVEKSVPASEPVKAESATEPVPIVPASEIRLRPKTASEIKIRKKPEQSIIRAVVGTLAYKCVALRKINEGKLRNIGVGLIFEASDSDAIIDYRAGKGLQTLPEKGDFVALTKTVGFSQLTDAEKFVKSGRGRKIFAGDKHDHPNREPRRVNGYFLVACRDDYGPILFDSGLGKRRREDGVELTDFIVISDTFNAAQIPDDAAGFRQWATV